MQEQTRRNVLVSAAATAAAIIAPALPVAATCQTWIKPYPLGDHSTTEQWEKREDRKQPWMDWWGEAETEAFCRAWAPQRQQAGRIARLQRPMIK